MIYLSIPAVIVGVLLYQWTRQNPWWMSDLIEWTKRILCGAIMALPVIVLVLACIVGVMESR